MEAAPVDERDRDRRPPQVTHRLKAAEAAADDDDLVPGASGRRAHAAPRSPGALNGPL